MDDLPLPPIGKQKGCLGRPSPFFEIISVASLSADGGLGGKHQRDTVDVERCWAMQRRLRSREVNGMIFSIEKVACLKKEKHICTIDGMGQGKRKAHDGHSLNARNRLCVHISGHTVKGIHTTSY